MPNIENAEEFVVNINNVEGEDIARIDGYYENMTVGNAEQLVSSVYVEDKEPYNFRTSGGSADIGNRLTEKIVGGSLVWNQIQASNVSRTNNGITYTFSNGKLTVQGTSTGNSLWVGAQQATSWNWYANHVYLVDVGNNAYSGASNKNWRIPLLSGGSDTIRINSPMEFIKPSADFVAYLTFSVSNGTVVDPAEEYYPQVFDLTQMFGSAVADYVYSLEQATSGAGIAWFKKLFPKQYYSYNAGEIMSVKASSHDTVGFNQWDEEWEAGTIASVTGANVNDQTRVRAKNNIPVLPNTTYYFKASAGSLALYYYDSDGEYIGFRSAQRNSTFTTIENAAYIRFTLGGSVNPVTNIDRGTVCVNLSWSGYRNGEYEEYKKRSYPLDTSLELRGVPKLDSSNNMYYDGDTYESDGRVTRKYGIVDLGTLNWVAGEYESHIRFNAILDGAYADSSCGLVSTRFISNAAPTGTNGVDRAMTMFRNGRLYIRDDAYSTASDFTTAMSGVYLVYELAEPTTETAEPFQSPQIVDDFGTEEYVDYGVIHGDRDVAIPVGHETQYMSNLRDKLQRMPDVPSANGTYLVQYQDGEMSYVAYIAPTELPSNPTTDGSYHLVCTVSDGQASYSWEQNT